MHNRSNVGYAFINFLRPDDAEAWQQQNAMGEPLSQIQSWADFFLSKRERVPGVPGFPKVPGFGGLGPDWVLSS